MMLQRLGVPELPCGGKVGRRAYQQFTAKVSFDFFYPNDRLRNLEQMGWTGAAWRAQEICQA
jgi:hypothetical protein